MRLEPLLTAAPAIQLHAISALLAFAIAALQFAGRKGTTRHRLLGWLWVALMATISGSSFFIHELRQFGRFSLLHLLAVLTLAWLPLGVMAARSGRVGVHRRIMIWLFVGGLVLAGAFTVLPGRIMHDVLIGG